MVVEYTVRGKKCKIVPLGTPCVLLVQQKTNIAFRNRLDTFLTFVTFLTFFSDYLKSTEH